MSEEWSDDDIARVIGNRAISHLRTMYPEVYKATGPSCRLSLRNHIRNDIAALLNAMRGNERMQDYILARWGQDAEWSDDTKLVTGQAVHNV
jgi:hypothetical protein